MPASPATGADSTCGVSTVSDLSARADKEYRSTGDLDDVYIAGIGQAKKQDCARAFDTFETAAANGSKRATNALGEMYEAGTAPKRDLERAIVLYKRAASSGEPRAIYNLGRLLAGGDLTPAAARFDGEADASSGPAWANDVVAHSAGEERLHAAAALWKQSADAGDHLAQYRLGQLYEGGFGVPRDTGIALELYRAAAPFVPEAHDAAARLESQ
jgi:hypothetical protein